MSTLLVSDALWTVIAPLLPPEPPKPRVGDRVRSRTAPRSRGIIPRIARRGVESSEWLGRYRWVVERTLSWLNRFRRLKVRYERRGDIHEGLLTLGCSLICWKALCRASNAAEVVPV